MKQNYRVKPYRALLALFFAGAFAITAVQTVFASTDGATESEQTAAEAVEAQPEGQALEPAALNEAAEAEAVGAKEAVAEPAAAELTQEEAEAEAKKEVETFLQLVAGSQIGAAYESGAPDLRQARTQEVFRESMTATGLVSARSVEWTNVIGAAGGLRLDGTVTIADGEQLPVFAMVLGEGAQWKVLDLQVVEPFTARLFSGSANALDIMMALFMIALLGAFFYIIWSYARGLKGSPREIYLLFFTKVTEYSAYGGANMAFILYLSDDLGMSDIGAGSYIGAWSMALTVVTMVVGAVCDAIGIKITLLIGCFALLISRFCMPFVDSIWTATVFGFLPLAVGIAITGPVLKVGIKKYTTRAGATLGFGLFYTLMNVGWAIGAWIFDAVRGVYGDGGSASFAGIELSTYQIIIGVGFLLTIPDLFAILWMRRGVERQENGEVTIEAPPPRPAGESLWGSILAMTKSGTAETVRIFRSVLKERAFWVYLFMLGILIFVRLTFYHFHYTFPKYGIRVFGEGVKIGSIFGVLNPVLIIFLVPLIASLTQKVRSYKMLLIGTALSAGSVFLTLIPLDFMAQFSDGWLGQLVFDRWLEVPFGRRDPFYLSLVVFIFVFTIGEAIWSPRLMQFSAEIAPKGREGSYIALAFLPYFLSKFIVGPMSGWLIATYVPEGATSYPNHHMVWIWIGGMAMISPIGLIVFRKMFARAENQSIDEAETTIETPDDDSDIQPTPTGTPLPSGA